MFHVVLIEPEIPPNTGNIARLCLATGSRLHLVGPLGFSIEDKMLRRAGLDYWEQTDVHQHESLEAFQRALPPDARLFYLTTKANRTYTEANFAHGDWLVFGRETRGLPESLLRANPEQLLTIPTLPEVRSLNLATSVGIVLFEALRQTSWSPECKPASL